MNSIDKKVNLMIKRATRMFMLIFVFYVLPVQAQVGINYDLNVEDPTAFLFTMNSYINSDEGSSGSATVILRQNIANGVTPTTHNLAVIWPDYNSMQLDFGRNATSPAWAAFQRTLGKSSSIEGNVMFAATGLSNGDETIVTNPNQFRRFINFTVEPHNVAEYVETLTDLWEDCDDSVHQALYNIYGAGEGGWTHAVVQTAPSFENLLSGQGCDPDAVTEFYSNASNIREVKNEFIGVDMMIWQP